MEMAEREARIKRLLEKATETRGTPRWEYLIRKDPDAFEAYQAMYEKGLMPGKYLPVKTRELIAMAILAYRGSRDGVISHGRRAKKYGATKEEIIEAALTTLIPGGAPTCSLMLEAARTIEEDEQKEKTGKK